MASHDQLIVITGPTASGKSALAMELAEQYNGEIVCADSRTVYTGMDIGTAKPSKADQARVRHHLLDVVTPDTRFTAADFQVRAQEAITDIRSRGKVPFVVGGTGLYIDGLILQYQFGQAADRSRRAELEDLSVEELQAMLKKQHISLPENQQNKRYLVRALEQSSININRLKSPQSGTVVVAIATEKAELYGRISKRADEIFAGPILDEANMLALRYGWDHESMTGNIYPLARKVIDGTLSIDEAKRLFTIKDMQLAKRQITWLKRHSFVQWLSIEEARTYLQRVLE